MAWNQDFGEGANPGSSYEQQSWRDSFNGGKAAGDWTGNHNARLDAERAAFGTTWSGSSTQPSALQLAQSFVGSGPAVGSVAAGGPANSGVGPGNPLISTAPQVVTAGPGRRVVVFGGGPLSVKTKDTATGGYAGVGVNPNPWFSDVENWWEPRYGEPGEWLGGIVNIGADAVFNVRSWADALRDPAAPKVEGPRGMDPIWGNPGGQQTLDFLSGVGAGFVLSGPTRDADLPDPMGYRPASAW